MKTLLRRSLSLLLSAVMLFSLGAEAFADTLTLPAALETIEDEAFYGDASLDEVIVPYGATSIGERAFADSGVKRITIPESVQEIDPTAFDGLSDDFTIYAPQYSYGYEYAMNRRHNWADTMKAGLESALEVLDEDWTSLEDAEQTIDELSFEALATGGITDPAALALIEEINAAQADCAALNAEMIELRDGFAERLEEFDDYLAENRLEVTEDAFVLNSDTGSYTIPAELFGTLGEGVELTSMDMLADGSMVLELQDENCVSCYLKVAESGLSDATAAEIEEVQAARASGIVPENYEVRAAALLDNIGNQLNIIGDILSWVTTLFGDADSFIENAYRNATEAAEAAEKRYLGLEELNKTVNNGDISAAYHKAHLEYDLRLKALSSAEGLFRFWKNLNLAALVGGIAADYNNMYQLSVVASHGHPTAEDSNDEDKANQAGYLCSVLLSARIAVLGRLIYSGYQLISGLDNFAFALGLAAGPAGWGAAVTTKLTATATKKLIKAALKRIGVEAAVNYLTDFLVKDTLAMDAKLHAMPTSSGTAAPKTATLTGYVYDAATGYVLSDVSLSFGSATVTTGANGKYSMTVPYGSGTLSVSREGYNTRSQQVSIAKERTVCDLWLQPGTMTIRVYAADEETNETLYGLTVTLDGSVTNTTSQNGWYYFSDVTAGQHSLRMEKSGYITGDFTINVKRGQTDYGRKLKKEPVLVTVDGTVTDSETDAPLSGVTVTLDGESSTTTDSAGHYAFSGVGKGAHTLLFEKTGYVERVVPFTVTDTALGVDVPLKKEEGEPEPVAGEFWLWCVEQFDTDGDGELSEVEILDVTEIDCSGLGFTSLEGIKRFRNLEYLFCYANQLTSLNVSGCSALNTLSCDENYLTSLDVSDCSALQKLYCYNNQLTSLDVSGCTALQELWCYYNQLTSLNISGCTALQKLSCSYNQLTSLNVSGRTALQELGCSNNQLTSLNVSGYTALRYLSCSDNRLTSLNVSNCMALQWLYCYNNQLTSLNVSGCTALWNLECHDNNQLTSLDASGCTALQELRCYNNQLTSLDVSGCTALQKLICSNNQLTSLNVSGCTALQNINCQNNQLTSLNVSGCTALRELHCYNNQLTSLDVSGCTALKTLNCHNNQLTSLNASGCTALQGMDCEDNQLTSLNVSGCSALRGLYCYNNQLTSLDVSGCRALETLRCNDNQLTSLNVSGCTALQELYCYNNQLTSLNVSGCTALQWLICENNQLTSIDIRSCPNCNVACGEGVTIVL